MAEFLVECMLADALLLGQCGAQEPTQDDQETLRDAPKAEIRRKRKREWMQRSRQTQREHLERLRTTVQTLTQYLDVAVDTQRFCHSPWAETALSLESEKRRLQQALLQHVNARQCLVDVVASDQPRAPDTATLFPEYQPITRAQAQAAISACSQDIAQYGHSAQPLSHWISDANTPARTFGWTVTCDMRPGGYIYLAMTKKLKDVSADQAMQQSWAAVSRPYAADKSPSQRLARSMLLQELDGSTSVMGTDWHHPLKPGVCMRSITVRTFGTTQDGYFVSLGTLNPQDPELRSQPPHGVEYMDKLTWHDFADETGGCVATLKTLSHYDTLENLHLKLVNALSSAWRWESEVTSHLNLLML